MWCCAGIIVSGELVYKGCYHYLFALFSMDTIGSIHMDLSFLEVEGFKKADCQQTSL